MESQPAQLVVTPVLGWLSDVVGKKIPISACLALSSVLFLCYMLVETPFQVVLISVSLSVLLSANCMLLARLSDTTPRRLSGIAMGLCGTFEDLGMMLGPLPYGLIWSAYGPVYIFVASSATQIVSILIFRFISRT